MEIVWMLFLDTATGERASLEVVAVQIRQKA